MGEGFLRQATCNQCLHGKPNTNYKKSYCNLTKREGNAERACWCKKFESRLKRSSDEVSEAGFKYRSKQIEDYRTRRQWEEAGYQVKEEADGHEMHALMGSLKTYIYFLPDEVMPMSSAPECCGNCVIRDGRYCPVAGDYVNMIRKGCSEWQG